MADDETTIYLQGVIADRKSDMLKPVHVTTFITNQPNVPETKESKTNLENWKETCLNHDKTQVFPVIFEIE